MHLPSCGRGSLVSFAFHAVSTRPCVRRMCVCSSLFYVQCKTCTRARARFAVNDKCACRRIPYYMQYVLHVNRAYAGRETFSRTAHTHTRIHSYEHTHPHTHSPLGLPHAIVRQRNGLVGNFVRPCAPTGCARFPVGALADTAPPETGAHDHEFGPDALSRALDSWFAHCIGGPVPLPWVPQSHSQCTLK